MRTPEAGAALIVTLMLTTLLAFLGGALVFIIDVETAISANHRLAHEVRDAAESGIECAIAELGQLPDWSAVPGGTVASALGCLDAAGPAVTPDGTPLDLARLTAGLQVRSDERYGSAANSDSPTWVVLARGLVAAPRHPAPYVIVWVADDVDDGDGRPEQEQNSVLMLKARAFGSRNAQAGIEAIVARVTGEGTQPSGVRLLGWRRWR